MEPERVVQLPSLPPRVEESHKGSYGRVLIIAGGRGMSGAAALAGMGALRGGAGLVYLATPASIAPIVAGMEPSYLVAMLPEDEQGLLATTPLDEALSALLPDKDALAIGPGLGQSPAIERLIIQLYRTGSAPLVCDADALNALAHSRPNFVRPAGPRVLTPHPGEFARLLGTDTKSVQADREGLAVDFARRQGVVLLLKGHRTIITDGARIAINETGNSGMASGGCGDVLTGLIAALIGQGMSPFDAAQLGAHLHGLAGDIAAKRLSRPGLIASDLPWHLGEAFLVVGS